MKFLADAAPREYLRVVLDVLHSLSREFADRARARTETAAARIRRGCAKTKPFVCATHTTAARSSSLPVTRPGGRTRLGHLLLSRRPKPADAGDRGQSPLEMSRADAVHRTRGDVDIARTRAPPPPPLPPPHSGKRGQGARKGTRQIEISLLAATRPGGPNEPNPFPLYRARGNAPVSGPIASSGFARATAPLVGLLRSLSATEKSTPRAARGNAADRYAATDIADRGEPNEPERFVAPHGAPDAVRFCALADRDHESRHQGCGPEVAAIEIVAANPSDRGDRDCRGRPFRSRPAQWARAFRHTDRPSVPPVWQLRSLTVIRKIDARVPRRRPRPTVGGRQRPPVGLLLPVGLLR